MLLLLLQMAPDGNCFFRAVADQLEGDAGSHHECRQKVVGHMKANADMFAPFVEDDEGFERYITRMGRVRC